uniref:Uncharacterized protein n=1 Tax=Chromera velia CCMP2878 TaxID=1169474 RepID=A0A0G4IDL0_9ALVE|eukprot:Cvel_13313.t1-p1 / transcript=Cvel_13313.t1 / gene=Cvel_13313 / organism=Chromera_velia_CCMP2878 / gene_product=hypothetical protein / transcript_product=hypothetical protein / location=Cvel_scaffold903:49040-51412(+) / protein_length=392 / sequence_SO=supercontig / SO=protein_coding / is_pseudo=false
MAAPASPKLEETRPKKHARHEDPSGVPSTQSGLSWVSPVLQTVFLPINIVLHGFPALPKLQQRKWRVSLYGYLAPELDKIGVRILQSSLDVHKDQEAKRLNVSFTCKIAQKVAGGEKPEKQVVAAVVNRLTGFDGQLEAGERLSPSERAAQVLLRQRTAQDWDGIFDRRPQVSQTRFIVSFRLTEGLPLGKVVGEPGEALRVGAESLFIALQKVRCWQEPPLLCRATESSSCSHGAAERPLDDFRGLLGSTYFSSSKQKDARNPLPRSVEISVDHESWPIDERERELLEKAFDGASEKDARRKETMLRSKPKQRHSAPPSQTAQDGDVIEIGGGGSEQQAAGGPEEQEGEGSGMQDQTMGGQNVEGPGRGEQDVVWSERPRVGGPERQEVQG